MVGDALHSVVASWRCGLPSSLPTPRKWGGGARLGSILVGNDWPRDHASLQPSCANLRVSRSALAWRATRGGTPSGTPPAAH
eukprot:3691441-Karenia_brevis.AAC.1